MIMKHDIVQVNEMHDWIGCLVYVTEVTKWGVQGFVQVPRQGQAFIRLRHEQYNFIGHTVLQMEDSEV